MRPSVICQNPTIVPSSNKEEYAEKRLPTFEPTIENKKAFESFPADIEAMKAVYSAVRVKLQESDKDDASIAKPPKSPKPTQKRKSTYEVPKKLQVLLHLTEYMTHNFCLVCDSGQYFHNRSCFLYVRDST